jgi:DNA-directed RNA polymerase subunit RPC12/RpoP
MNEATELVEGVPLCPACRRSVAVVNKVRAIRARKLENAAKGIYHCAKCGKSLVTPDSVYMSGDHDEPEIWRCPDCDKQEMAKRPIKAAEYSVSNPDGDDPAILGMSSTP